jgi:YidC/Oxa1 family membrane protein insertase
MDSRRVVIAIALSVAVLFGMQFLFPPKPEPKRAPVAADSVAAHRIAAARAESAAGVVLADSSRVAGATAAGAAPNAPTVNAAVPMPPAAPAVAVETTVVAPVAAKRDSGATFELSNVGAVPVTVVMNTYASRVGGHDGAKVRLGSAGNPILKYQLVTNGGQPVDLSGTSFQSSRAGNVVTYSGSVAGSAVNVQYATVPDSFLSHVRGSVAGAKSGSYLVVQLPQTFATTEPDTADDRNSLAFAFLSKREAARNVPFHSLDPGEKQLVEGPVTWIVAKSKYFVVGLLAPKKGPEFTEATLIGGSRTTKVATHADGTVVIPVVNGEFAFDIYAGPQEWKKLNALGRDFDQVNPYGWAFVRPLMQPIATSVIRVVLWMHSKLNLSYGMVLIALGLLVRLLMWPLYQTSMKTSIKMQILQPELTAVQAKYKEDPEKQRAEIMKVYQAHGMNPLSPLLGCLPSLLPMPILLALFFVFRNTIEFRGVPFWWMSDLSVRDPYYILPLLMGASMYLISWIGMRNTPPNPQAKMMTYIMPAMFTLFLYREAAGLNLYYATQNFATLPQQWHLSRTRGGMKPGGVAADKAMATKKDAASSRLKSKSKG